MRIEDINEKNIKKAKNSELYSLKLRMLQIWEKLNRKKQKENKFENTQRNKNSRTYL